MIGAVRSLEMLSFT